MRVTGVIVRFLSLLDVVIVMLGILLLAMAQSQLRKPKPKVSADGPSTAIKDAVENRFVYLFAGVKDSERGKVYQLGPGGKRLREVRTDTDEDLKQILSRTAVGKNVPNSDRSVILIVGTGGFDSMWSARRFSDMEKAWGLKVVPMYNMDLDKLPK